jgi:signal peptidase I
MRRLSIVLVTVSSVLLCVAVAFILFLIVDAGGGAVYKNVSRAMEPALLDGDRFTVRLLPRGKLNLTRGELVTHAWPPDPSKRFVKRVLGLPGDTLAMREGVLQLNGRALSEPYAWHEEPSIDPVTEDFQWQRRYLVAHERRAQYVPSRNNWGPIVVPASECFVLGDNRDNSLDSRYWGFVPIKDVLGLARRVYYSSDPVTGRVRWSRLGHLLR